MDGAQGGAWTEEVHRTQALDFNEGLARYISDTIAPTSVLEFGSGLGHVAKFLNANGSQVVHCIEPYKMAGGAYDEFNGPVQFDVDIFRRPPPEQTNRTYDLVMSIEVAEHIERELHGVLFDFLVSRASDWIVFSGARIGQAGHGHIACRDELDWRSEFTDRGMKFLPEMTRAVREHSDHGRQASRNVQVFRKQP